MKKSSEKTALFLSKTFLFSGIPYEEICELIYCCEYECIEYEISEIICSPKEFQKRIGFVVNGECTVERRNVSESVTIPLNKIKGGECFGILSIFSEEEELPTFIRASKKCKILYITQTSLLDLINKDARIAMNLIKFMSNKISFLNKKLSTFLANNTRQKVANYIYYLSEKNGNEFKLNCQKTSVSLNIGRASLYRSIDSLVEDGIIDYTSGLITILDKNKLERISK